MTKATRDALIGATDALHDACQALVLIAIRRDLTADEAEALRDMHAANSAICKLLDLRPERV